MKRLSAKKVRCVHARADRMAGEIYAKAFTDADKWKQAQELINVVDPTRLKRAMEERPAKNAELEKKL